MPTPPGHRSRRTAVGAGGPGAVGPAPATRGPGASSAGRTRDATGRPAADRVRRADHEDAPAIARIAVAGWRAAYGHILPADYLAGLSVEAREAAWRRLLETSPDAMPAWVAELDGEAAGFVSAGPPRDADVAPPAAEVYAIYVRPDAIGRGIGRALLGAAVAHLRRRGAADIVLWVFRDNARARAFYEASGWRTDGGIQEIDLGAASAIEVRYRLSTGEPLPGRGAPTRTEGPG